MASFPQARARCECGCGWEGVDEVADFCFREAVLEASDALELLDELRAHKSAQPLIPPDVQRDIDKFRSFR